MESDKARGASARVRASGSARPRRELRCRTCGYGIIVAGPPPNCPMCRSDEWEFYPIVERTTEAARTKGAF